MRVTATEAKNRFGSLCAQAKREPVFVEKAGQLDTVILSAKHYQALQAQHGKIGLAARKMEFESEFADWIASQNAHVEQHGIPGSDLRPWWAADGPYDVYANPSNSAAAGIPYVVVIQSDLLDALATRLTVPLAVPDLSIKVPTALCPLISVKGKRLHALVHYAAPLPAKLLRRPVDNIAEQSSALVSAIDVVLSGV